MGEHAQKRLIRKLDLERFLSQVASQPNPKVHLEQYTVSEQLAANTLYVAAYVNDDIVGKSVLDLRFVVCFLCFFSQQERSATHAPCPSSATATLP